ncbi:hypothetical protein V8E36_009217 [Tilletia maclaganii]
MAGSLLRALMLCAILQLSCFAFHFLQPVSGACNAGESRPGRSKTVSDNAGQERLWSASQLGLSSVQYEELFGKALSHHVEDNACYRDVLEELVHSKTLSSVHDEAVKKRGAIALFLCDVDADSLPVPQSCKADNNFGKLAVLTPLDWGDDRVQACTRALHRVPQLWASFDNHRKALPLLIFIQQHKQGVDEAKKVFKAIARQQQDYLAHLHAASTDQHSALKDATSELRNTATRSQQENKALLGAATRHVMTELDATSERSFANLTVSITVLLERLSETNAKAFSSSVELLNDTAQDTAQQITSRSIDTLDRQAQSQRHTHDLLRAAIEAPFAPHGSVSVLLSKWSAQLDAKSAYARSERVELEHLMSNVRQVIAGFEETAADARRIHAATLQRVEQEQAERVLERQKRPGYFLSALASLGRQQSDLDWSELITAAVLRHGLPSGIGPFLFFAAKLTWWAFSNILCAVLGCFVFALTASRRRELTTRQMGADLRGPEVPTLPGSRTLAIAGQHRQAGPLPASRPRACCKTAVSARMRRNIRASTAPP